MKGADDLQMIDAISFLKRNPEIFFRSGAPNTAELIERLETYLAFENCGPVEITVQGDVVVVSAASDWMRTDQPVGILFEHLHPTPDRGLNTDRPEVFIAAFSRAWRARGDAGPAFGPADADVTRALSTADPKWRRVLAWKTL